MEREIGIFTISEPEIVADGSFSIISLQTPQGLYSERIEVRGVRQNMPYPQEVQALAAITLFDRAEHFGVDLGLTKNQKDTWRNIGLEPLPFPEPRKHQPAV